MTQLYSNELAQLYDVAVPDWPGEIQFYCQLAREANPSPAHPVLELASGTGRVTVQLARQGVPMVGVELSEDMLAFAKAKSTTTPYLHWIQADMRHYKSDRSFSLALIPAYSFQLLLSDVDQIACLSRVSDLLLPGARLALHLERHDPDWLAALPTDRFTPFEASGETCHPATGDRIRVSYAWSFVAAQQSVAVVMRYDTLDSSGHIRQSRDQGPLLLHCTEPDALERMLVRCGMETEALWGSFVGDPFNETSDELVWVARKPL